MSFPILYLLAGPNGAGKSTLYEQIIKPKTLAPFINADVIQKTEMQEASMEASYEAARIAKNRREDAIKMGTSFVTETVFSHPSKLDLIASAKRAGFYVMVFHVGIETDDLSVARVKARKSEGGHDVPEHKIRERFVRNKALIKQAVLLSDKGFIYDNSHLNIVPKLILTFNNGTLNYRSKIPKWVAEIYGEFL